MCIIVLQNCTSNPNIPPQFKTRPPSIVETVDGDTDITITADYEVTEKDDPNLGVYWCVYFTQYNYYCYNSGDDDNQFVVTTDGCPPYDSKCCYYTVILRIRSLTLNLSGITLQSMVIWKYDPGNFVKSNSTLGMSVVIGFLIVNHFLLQWSMCDLPLINHYHLPTTDV